LRSHYASLLKHSLEASPGCFGAYGACDLFPK
jgi:hypothetical protein